MAKRVLRAVGVVVAVPIVAFLLLAVALCVPAVQQWVVGGVCRAAGSALSARVSVERVRLAFPLDLSLHGVQAMRGDTVMLRARAVRVGVQLWPLLGEQVQVDGFELFDARVNTLNLISDVQVSGTLRSLTAAAHGVDLKREQVRVDRVHLVGADVLVALSDTAAPDTTPSTARWVVCVDRARIDRSRVAVRLPGDSLRVGGYLQMAELNDGLFDTGAGRHFVRRLRVQGSDLHYDVPYIKRQAGGFDPSHIALTTLRAEVDSLQLAGGGRVAARVGQLAAAEQCGLRVTNLTARLTTDSTRLRVSGMQLALPHSRLQAAATIDLAALAAPASGALQVQLDGHVARADVLPFFARRSDVARLLADWPAAPLRVSATVGGNRSHLVLRQARLSQPGTFTLAAAGHLDYMEQAWRNARLRFDLATCNLDFVHRMAHLGSDVTLPPHMRAEGTVTLRRSRVGLDMQGRVGAGRLSVRGSFDPAGPHYNARLSAQHFPLQAFLPTTGLANATLSATLSGRGTNLFVPSMQLRADVALRHLQVAELAVDSVQLAATLHGGHGRVHFDSRGDLVRGVGDLSLTTSRAGLVAALKASLQRLDLQRMGASPDTLTLAADVDLTAHANRRFTDYGAAGSIDGLRLTAAGGSHALRRLDLKFDNRADTLWARVQSGDLTAGLAARGNAALLSSRLQRFALAVQQQWAAGRLDRQALRRALPDMGLMVRMGSDNPATAYLRYAMGYDLRGLRLNLMSTPHVGLRGEGRVLGLNTGALLLDSTHLQLTDDSTGLRLATAIINNSKGNPYPFEARLDGCLSDSLVGATVLYRDKDGREGIRLGTEAALSPQGVRLRITTPRPVIAYRRFAVNADNYVFLDRRSRDLTARVDLLADDGTGLKLYSNEDDSIPDVTMSVSRLNLAELSAVVPGMPRLAGLLGGDVHVQKENKIFSAVSDLRVNDLYFEDAPLGNVGLEFSYMPDENLVEHFVDAQFSRGDSVVAQVVGKYINRGDGELNMNLDLLNFPLDMLNGFAGGSVAFGGTLRGALALTGPASAPQVAGTLHTDSIGLSSPVYGFNLHTDSQTFHIADNQLRIDALHLYSIGSNPLTVSGSVNFKQFDRVMLALNMNARRFEIINAPKTQQSEVYGRVLANYQGTVSGTPSLLRVRGMLSVLADSRIGYVLKDSPLSVDDQLSDLVVFTNFSDTTVTATKARPELSGLDIMMGINIDEAAQLHCDLSSDEQSYFDVEGGGNLTFKYAPDGALTLTGRYTMGSGEMKYTLPVIPLRTFQIVSGSYIEFTGEPSNPTLSIRATERLRASVNENNNPRTVPFDVGVSLTRQLSNMGLEFTIEAPDDGTVQNQLAAMSREQRGKLAVSMLVTGMYLAENNSTSGFTANNALNAFLQSEIQQIAGNAMKSIDLSLSVDNGTTAQGTGQTDYSFRFAKRLWGNRVSIVIGGRVSTGAEAQNDATSFIDNVAIEYRLNRSASRYVRLYYNNDANDPLEGRLTKLGGGIVLRKKATRFGRLFVFWRRKSHTEAPAATPTTSQP